MLTFFATGRGKADKVEEVIAAIKNFVPTMKDETGTLEYVVYQQKDDPQRIVFFEKYRDQAAKDEHNKNPHLKEMMQIINSATEDGGFMGFFEEIASLDR